MKIPFIILLFFCVFNAFGIEVPIPLEYYSPLIFAVSSDGEFIVGTEETTSFPSPYPPPGSTMIEEHFFWLKTQEGVLTGPAGECLLFVENPPWSQWSSGSSSHAFFFWDKYDQPHFTLNSSSSFYDHINHTSSSSTRKEYVGSPGFLISESGQYTDGWGNTSTHLSTADYHITADAGFIALIHTHIIQYDYYDPYAPPISSYTTRVKSSNGFDKTYNGTRRGVPQFNSQTGNFHVIDVVGLNLNIIQRVLFSDTVTTKILYQSPDRKYDWDYQSDASDRLHFIWREPGSGYKYAVCDNDIMSSPVTISDNRGYLYSPKLKMNAAGDLYFYNINDDNYPVVWAKPRHAASWTQTTLSKRINDNLYCLDGFINEEGGVSLLGFTTYPPNLYFWQSPDRFSNMRCMFYKYAPPNCDRFEQDYVFLPDGNFGILMFKPDEEFIFTNSSHFSSQSTHATKSWNLYE